MPWTFYNASGQQLNTRSSSITHLDIDGATDIGAPIANGDLLINDDGAGGANRKTTVDRIVTYVGANTDTRSGVAKCWANINGNASPAVLRESYNTGGFTDNGVGDWTVTIGTDMDGTGYAAVVGGEDGVTSNTRFSVELGGAQLTTAVRLAGRIQNASTGVNAVADGNFISVVIMGAQ